MRPILIIIDIATINYLSLLFFNLLDKNLISYSAPVLNNKQLVFSVYITILWLVSTILIKFYKIYRYTASIQIITLIVKQFMVYFIIVFAFIGFFRSVDISAFVTLKYLASCLLIIGSIKIISYYLLKQYRRYFKGNLRNIVIVGSGIGAEELRKLFTLRKDLGYNIIGKDLKNNIEANIVLPRATSPFCFLTSERSFVVRKIMFT